MKSILSKSELYRSYVNDFLTVDKFAEYYGLSREQALSIIHDEREQRDSSRRPDDDSSM